MNELMTSLTHVGSIQELTDFLRSADGKDKVLVPLGLENMDDVVKAIEESKVRKLTVVYLFFAVDNRLISKM